MHATALPHNKWSETVETVQTILLAAILAAFVFEIVDRRRRHAELVKWLDALGDATTDMLRAILDELRGAND